MNNLRNLLFTLVLFVCGVASAETYKVYCAWPAGSSPDVMVRRLLDTVQNNTGDVFVIINKPGADGAIAAANFAADKTTPHKLLATTVSAVLDMPSEVQEQTKSLILYFKLGYLLISHADSNINNPRDVKGRLNIGNMSYNKTGDMFVKHIVRNPDVQFINYPSDAELMTAMVRKDIDLANITDANIYYKAHKEKYKVVTSYEMLNATPGIGLLVSKDMSSETTVKLNSVMNIAMQEAEFKKWFFDTIERAPIGGKPEALDAAVNSVRVVRDKKQ